MVNLMLAVELEFDIAIAQADITPENFHSLSSIGTWWRAPERKRTRSGRSCQGRSFSAATSAFTSSPLGFAVGRANPHHVASFESVVGDPGAA